MLKRICILVGIAACFAPACAHADPRVSRIHRLCAEMGLSPALMIFFIASRASPRLPAFRRLLRRRAILATPICTPMATSGIAIGT